MSIRFGAAMLAALAVGSVAAQDTTSDKGKLSYAIGFEIGTDFVDKKMDVDVATVIRGIQDGIAKKQPAVAPDQMRAALDKMREKLMTEAKTKYEQLARENKAKSDKFLAENKIKKGIVSLPSGIQYRVIEEGNGKRPLKNSEVTVHYRGSLTSGLEFDSSFARGVPAKFKVDAVLKGWQDILPMMKVGDHWQIFLPPEQAYGMRGQGPIGPNEALVFEIKLVDVK
ncbi:MAG TPA: FKBP-type peptidyl-prolyl cis-trans isomerase [Pseudomonadota bacterium]|jgi:FKBP-type peptidyl-prolyl cis-trans isomerase FklB|nr:FKBP-type peptidyl-prolyl cis-trans isomerase [Pseudomonadota bacterium]